MNQIKTGQLIRALRQKRALTQRALAETLRVSDKTVSKWERGRGAPDISLLPALAQALGVDVEALLAGAVNEPEGRSGTLKTLRFSVCPQCGSLAFAAAGAAVRCCGRKLAPLPVQPAAPDHALEIVQADGEWYVTSRHEMRREHFLSFLAFRTDDTLFVKKLYPEWGAEVRIPFYAHGTLFWHCTRHGLFSQEV